MLGYTPRLNQKLNTAPLGGDNNLAVVLAPYEPNIQCGSAEAFTHPPSCGGILVDMPASTAEMRFGPRGVPGVNEPLPQYIASGKRILERCSRGCYWF